MLFSLFNSTALQVRFIILLAVIMTVLIGSSLVWNIHNETKQIVKQASIAARENFNKDQAFRRWGTLHGGVYVTPDKRTPPSPYLAHLPDRDIETTDGKKLTLMNPAYMLRQMMDEYSELYGVKAKITGLILLNPNNAPDEWEKKALHKFLKGIKEVKEVATINGKAYLRLMRPMFMTKGCVKCHGHLGFKEGDLRGGVGVAIPLDTYKKNASEKIKLVYISHAALWLFGLFCLYLFYQYARKYTVKTEVAINLEKDKRAAEEASRTKSKFLSHMSHELRTPMNAILGFAQLLDLDKKDFNRTQQENIQEILDAGEHLLHLINDVLDLGKIESGKLVLDIANVSLSEIIQQCLTLLSEQVEKKNIKIVDNVTEKKYMVYADSTRLKQVLLNFLSNAIKYNVDGGSIVLNAKPVGDKILHISITDTGNGLSKEDISKLFNSFERLNIDVNVEGAGVGLKISKQLVEMMNGKVGVQSMPGEGSTFWFEIPLFGNNTK